MADRFWFILYQSLLKKPVHIVGSFGTNGASDVLQTSVFGKGYTVHRTGVGQYTVTLADIYAKLISANTDLQLAAVSGNFSQLGVYTKASKTLVINTLTAAGAPVDVASDPNNRVHFHLVLSVSTED